MIIDLPRFIAAEQPYWDELRSILDAIDADPNRPMGLQQSARFHYLYERSASDLARLGTFASEPETRQHLESLVGRAYAEIHESRRGTGRIRPFYWFFVVFPETFRRHFRAFLLSVTITLVGAAFGGFAIALDPSAKEVLMPFSYLQQSPEERVATEENVSRNQPMGERASFSAFLMTHNTRVSVLTMALGVTWAAGTILMLFINGIMVGAVAVDYVRAGQTSFLLGWLLPHGSFEIPAILIAGQAGLLLGRTLIGTGSRKSLSSRLRSVADDLVTLIFGVAILLVWAGFVESFFSQYHQPVIPYSIKILFGSVELVALTVFLWKSGTRSSPAKITEAGR